MKTVEEIRKKLTRVKDAHNYDTNKDTNAYTLQEGFITALEWVLKDSEDVENN